MHKVSIIIPYYKKELFIKKTIRSVLNQTYTNFEIILLYDDTDKKDLDFIRKLKSLDKRIKLFINKKNLGAGRSRNKGIELAKGEYLCFLDADDTWKKNKLRDQLKFMKYNRYLATHTSYEIVNLNNRVIAYRKAKNFYKYQELLPSCDIGLSTVILNRKILKKKITFPKIKTKEDFVFWLMILKRGFSIHAFDKKLTQWTKSNNSLSSNTIQKLLDGYLVYRKYMKLSLITSIYYLIILSINFLKKK